MTREEAFAKSAEEGIWITHEYFTEDDRILVDKDGYITTDDKYTVSIERFNTDHQAEGWDVGWSIYE